MKRTIKVRVTNDSTGEIWEYPWYNCHSKFQAIRKMFRLMRKHISYSGDFNRIEVWEDIEKVNLSSKYGEATND